MIRCHDELWVSWHLCLNSSITLGCTIKKVYIHFVGIFKIRPFWHLPQFWRQVRVRMSLPSSVLASLKLSVPFTLLSCFPPSLAFLPSLSFPSFLPLLPFSSPFFLRLLLPPLPPLLLIPILYSLLCILVFLVQVFIIYPFARYYVGTNE